MCFSSFYKECTPGEQFLQKDKFWVKIYSNVENGLKIKNSVWFKAVKRRCSVEKVSLKILQNSQENIYALSLQLY